MIGATVKVFTRPLGAAIPLLAALLAAPLLSVGCGDTAVTPDSQVPGISTEAAGEPRAHLTVPPRVPESAPGGDVLRPTAEEILVEEGIEVSLPSLLERAGDEDESLEVRFLSALVLGKMGDESAVPVLIELLQGDEAELRRAAVVALGQLESPQVVPSLTQALADSAESVRLAAVGALASLGGDEAAFALAEKVTDTDEPSEDVRANAAFHLGDMQASVARPWLLDALDDASLQVRTAAAVALADLGDSRAIPVLIETLKDTGARDWLVVKAIAGLKELTGLDFGFPKPYWAPATEEEREKAIRGWIEWWENQ